MSDDPTTTSRTRGPLGVLGFGAAACAAGCIGPIVAFFGSIGVLGALSTPFVGVLGLAVAVLAVAAAVTVRRRRRAACAVPAGPVPLDAPVRRTIDA